MDNILDAKANDNDESLRPLSLKDYIGQEKMKKNLEVFIKSAKIRKKTLDHMLFYGPPGLGKTTIAGVIANEMGSKMVAVTGPSIERQGDLVSIISSLKEGDVLFIDEIHRLPRYVEEMLYPVMEDFKVDVTIGQESQTKTIQIDLPRFTLIGATTRAGYLSSPLRDRFGSINRLELYTPKELSEIIKRDASILKIPINDDALINIGKRSRGTPRIAIRILKRLLDFAVVDNEKSPVITNQIADYGLSSLEVDEIGLDCNDLRILHAIHQSFQDGPVGLETLAAFVSEDDRTIEDVYEPYLMQIGFLSKTPRGRVLTEAAIEYLEKEKKDEEIG